MMNRELKFPEWQRALQEVILEFDSEKLSEKIQKMESVIFERLRQLDREANSGAERGALKDALRVLRILKAGQTRLAW